MKTIEETRDCQLLAELSEQVQNLHHQLYPDVFKPYSKPEILAHFEAEMKKSEVRAFVAMEDKELAGYVLIYINDEKENPFMFARRFIQLDQLLVLEKHRKKGIGTLLVNKVAAVAAELNIPSIKLNHWTANSEARAFFNLHDFVYCNERMTKDVKLDKG